MSKKRSKRPGHFCWCCQRRRPNERFSGRGHAHHLCRDCAKLGADELAYRQGVRNVERLLTFDGMIRRKQRLVFERFLHHPNERVRNYAHQIAACVEQERARRKAMSMLLADEDDHLGAGYQERTEDADLAMDSQDDHEEDSPDNIPF